MARQRFAILTALLAATTILASCGGGSSTDTTTQSSVTAAPGGQPAATSPLVTPTTVITTTSAAPTTTTTEPPDPCRHLDADLVAAELDVASALGTATDDGCDYALTGGDFDTLRVSVVAEPEIDTTPDGLDALLPDASPVALSENARWRLADDELTLVNASRGSTAIVTLRGVDSSKDIDFQPLRELRYLSAVALDMADDVDAMDRGLGFTFATYADEWSETAARQDPGSGREVSQQVDLRVTNVMADGHSQNHSVGGSLAMSIQIDISPRTGQVTGIVVQAIPSLEPGIDATALVDLASRLAVVVVQTLRPGDTPEAAFELVLGRYESPGTPLTVDGVEYMVSAGGGIITFSART